MNLQLFATSWSSDCQGSVQIGSLRTLIITWLYSLHRRYSMSRQKNSMLINEYTLNRETFSLIQFQSCFIIKRNIKSPTLMSRINDLNTIRESGSYGGSNDFISAKLGILICISYDYKREKNMLMLTSSPALSTQGRVDQISDKVSLLMKGISVTS